MPYACRTPCRQPGCHALVDRPGFCTTHSKDRHRRYNEERRARADPFDKLYGSTTWQTLRAQHLREEPLCVACRAQGRYVAGQVVDHILPVKQGGRFFDQTNLQTLCNPCHERKSHAEGSRF